MEKKRRSRKMTTMQLEMQLHMVDRIPPEILMEILSRLPTGSILQCSQVRRSWRDLILHPYFAHMHLQQLSHLNGNYYPCHSSVGAKVGFGFLFCFWFSRETGFQLYYGEYDDQPCSKLLRINQPPMNYHEIVGSCNGLICIAEMNFSNSVMFEPAFICNPITREYVNFPRLEVKGENKLHSMVCGFGYNHSIKKYKIVKIYYIQDQPLGQVQVYTLGDGSGWRDTGETNYSLRFSADSWSTDSCRRSPIGTFANGAVHWLDKDLKIVSFDLASEKLYLLSTPHVVHSVGVNLFQLQVLGGCLCFVHQKVDESLDIWFLRKKGGSNGSDVNEKEEDFLTWIREFSIPIGGNSANPLTLTKSGEILLCYGCNLYCYDPKTAVLEKLTNINPLSVVPHFNSFVSLKALGENCRRRKRYNVNPSPKEFYITHQGKPNGDIDA